MTPVSDDPLKQRASVRPANAPEEPPPGAIVCDPGASVVLPTPSFGDDGDGDRRWVQRSGPQTILETDAREGILARIPQAVVNTSIVFEARRPDSEEPLERITLWVAPDAECPAADAGPTQVVAEGEIVLLDGRGTRLPEGTDTRDVGWEWVQVAGPPIALSDPWSLTPAFRAPEGLVSSDVRLELRVTHGADDGTSSVSSVNVLVCGTEDSLAVDARPPGTVAAGDLVPLRAEAEVDPEAEISWRWRQIEGPGVELEDAGSASACFTAPVTWRNVALAFEVTAHDGQRCGRTRIEVTVEPDDEAPEIQIESNASVADGDRVTVEATIRPLPGPDWRVRWLQLAGPSVRLTVEPAESESIHRVAFFAPDVARTSIALACIASDGTETVVATTRIRIEGDEEAPQVDAGPTRFAEPGESLELSGHAETHEGRPTRILWSQIRGPRAPLSDATGLRPRLTVPELRGCREGEDDSTTTLVYALHALDGDLEAVDTVAIHVGAKSASLAIHTGLPREVSAGEAVRLGSWSEDELALLEQCTWRQVGGPAVQLEDENAPTAWFRAPEGFANTRLLFELDAVHGGHLSIETIAVLLEPDEDAPIVQVSADRRAKARELVRLSAFARDPEDLRLETRWRQIAGPPVALDDPASQRPTFAAPVLARPAELVFEFSASDGVVRVAETVRVLVDAASVDQVASLVAVDDSEPAREADARPRLSA